MLYKRYMQKCISDCKTRRILKQTVWSYKTPHWVSPLPDLMSFIFFCDFRKRQAFVVKQLESMDPSCLLPMVWTNLKVSLTVWRIYSCYTLETLNAAIYVLCLNLWIQFTHHLVPTSSKTMVWQIKNSSRLVHGKLLN